MSELIDKTAAYNALKHEAETHGLSFSAEAYDRAARIIDQMQTIEPEVRHGRWIPYGRDNDHNSYIRCSHCNHEVVMYADSEKAEPKYCEECGAKMYQTGGTISKKLFAEIGGTDNEHHV